jgi:hypothetical protein
MDFSCRIHGVGSLLSLLLLLWSESSWDWSDMVSLNKSVDVGLLPVQDSSKVVVLCPAMEVRGITMAAL